MKTFSVAVALAAVLMFMCVLENTAVPMIDVHELAEAMTDNYLVAADQQKPGESWKMPYDIRQKRHARKKRCRFCCGCCGDDMIGCGTCCKF